VEAPRLSKRLKTPFFVQLPEIIQPSIFNNSSTIAEMSQYHANSFNTNSINVSHNFTVTNDRSQLLTWLSPLEPRLRHRDIQERRVDNIGEWLMQTEEFRSWHDESGEGEVIGQSCLAMEIRGPVKHSLGKIYSCF